MAPERCEPLVNGPDAEANTVNGEMAREIDLRIFNVYLLGREAWPGDESPDIQGHGFSIQS